MAVLAVVQINGCEPIKHHIFRAVVFTHLKSSRPSFVPNCFQRQGGRGSFGCLTVNRRVTNPDMKHLRDAQQPVAEVPIHHYTDFARLRGWLSSL